MVNLIPVRYNKLLYPYPIVPRMEEIAGHFDKSAIKPEMPFSLHTEYSNSSRKWSTELIQQFPEIRSAVKDDIPKLWYSSEWAIEFAEFVRCLCNGHTPTVIEIHPPFKDYSSIDYFFSIYPIFENQIKSLYPDVQILIENRCGTRYKGARFALSTYLNLIDFSQKLDSMRLNLKLTLDVPQLFTAHGILDKNREKMMPLLDHLKAIRHNIYGIHLWGKSDGSRKIAHTGDLNSYFRSCPEMKSDFLKGLHELLDDGFPRYFVPEVNNFDGKAQENLYSIVGDLTQSDFCFV